MGVISITIFDKTKTKLVNVWSNNILVQEKVFKQLFLLRNIQSSVVSLVFALSKNIIEMTRIIFLILVGVISIYFLD